MGFHWSGTTPSEIARIARLRDFAGGYDEMDRLIHERRKIGPGAELIREPDGRLKYISAVEYIRRNK